MKNLYVLFFIFFSFLSFSQEEILQTKDSLTVDDKYLEDQIYLSITYNTLVNQPNTVADSGFSYGISAGFIKDLPLNSKRNFAFGIGVGYGFNSFNHGLKVSENSNQISYEIDNTLTSNKFVTHNIELPLELRWRNSTPTKYAFWRIYTGVKFSYNFSNTFSYVSTNDSFEFNNISSFNKFQTGLIVSAGYDAFNLHFYYGLTPIFKDSFIANDSIDTKILKFGLTFYIL
ncbi:MULTISPECIES: porin family protein [Tenacibaculum]|uniref:porin family protein n=1 Tax=Tenacibaculum TaxID=104267 RepID=UPI001F0AA9DF|nr:MULTISPECIES: porin family protein [Tenacibaculum]MCH3881673.1 PorT family protein [Tenacibaculum aquimarinum]MDO6598742.1 porin family protein [Tenacibaculum sp. 1_MG-2023]